MTRRLLPLLIFAVLNLIGSGPVRAERLVILSDLEGRMANLKVALAAGDLVIGAAGKMRYGRPDVKVIFNGDLFDRGADGIKLRQWFLDLHAEDPARLVMNAGNRDLNKLRFVADYMENVAKHGKDMPSLLKAFLKQYGLEGLLEFHRAEMSELAGAPVTEARAAEDFVQAILPGGKVFEFLRLYDIMYADVKSRTLFVHGGITLTNFGIVPGKPLERNPVLWAKKLNDWYADNLDLISRQFAAGKKVTSNLPEYGDFAFDPFGSQKLPVGQSVIAPERFKEGDNFRLPGDEVIHRLQGYGFDNLVLGHSPVGNVPLPLRNENGFMVYMVDTSYTQAGVNSYVTLENGVFHVRATTSAGTALDFKFNPKTEKYIGMLADAAGVVGTDAQGGFHVVGTDANGDYVLFRYFERRKIEEKIVKKGDMEKLKLRAPVALSDNYLDEAKANLAKYLSEKRLRAREFAELQETLQRDGKIPVLFSGASRFNNPAESEELIRAEVREMLAKMDPRKHVVITGGTHLGVEKIIHEETHAWNLANPGGKFELGAFIVTRTNTSELFRHLDWVSLVGTNWVDPLFSGIDLVQARKGMVIFIGGGPAVASGIKRAAALDVSFRVMGNVSEGASRYYSTVYEKNAFTKGAQVDFRPEAQFSAMQTPEEVKAAIDRTGKTVINFGGPSGQDFENPELVKRHFDRILKNFDPSKTMIMVGVTPHGIGKLYRWTKEYDKNQGLLLKYAQKFRDAGFETRGIVSSKGLKGLADPNSHAFNERLATFEYIRQYVDGFHVVLDETWGGYIARGVLSPTSEAIVSSAHIFYGFGGGSVNRDELTEALKRGKRVIFNRAEVNHEPAIARAQKAGKPLPTSFYGEADVLMEPAKEARRMRRCRELLQRAVGR